MPNFYKRRRKNHSPDPPGPQVENESTHQSENVLNVYSVDKSPNALYYGFKLYFDDEEFTKNPQLINKIEAAENFFRRNPGITRIGMDLSYPSYNIDIERFYFDENFMTEWSSFKTDIQDNPAEVLNCLGLAVHQRIVQVVLENKGYAYSATKEVPIMQIKILNYKPIISASNIKVKTFGKLIATRGCVIRVGHIKELIQWLIFKCCKCGARQVVKQPAGIVTIPKKCVGDCESRKFLPQFDSPNVKTVSIQVIKLQEHLDAIKDDRGRMPRVIEVELLNFLVGSCVPGEDVTIVGIVRARGVSDGVAMKKQMSDPSELYIEAVSIVNNKNKTKSTACQVEIEGKHFDAIQNIESRPDIFPLLVRSLCPSIYGHEMIKGGLLLSLFGGRSTQKYSRDNIHVLMVGDPGLGKSQMLQACARISSQGIYVCGSSSTSSGLTVTLSKEGGSNDFTVEPGALVLADEGCCLIDEFDKMPTQHQALLEAMEQQSVSVAKSGVICSLPARTSILSAANPIEGTYNNAKSVTGNLNLSQPLLSRFDLIFLLLDQRTQQSDAMLCSYFMNSRRLSCQPSTTSVNTFAPTVAGKLATLYEKLTKVNDGDEVVPQPILREYVAYAKQWVQPKLSPEAGRVLQEYYLELRKDNNLYGGSLPVYHRQLEALIRLTEARAKLELRENVTVSDAEEVVELFKFTLASVPEIGPRYTLKNDTGKVTGNKVKAFVKELANAAKATTCFSRTDLEELADEGGIVIDDFSRFIAQLNHEGILLKRGADKYEFVQQ